MANGESAKVKTKISVNGSVSSEDVYLSVRVEDSKVEQAIADINKLGFACKRMVLS